MPRSYAPAALFFGETNAPQSEINFATFADRLAKIRFYLLI